MQFAPGFEPRRWGHQEFRACGPPLLLARVLQTNCLCVNQLPLPPFLRRRMNHSAGHLTKTSVSPRIVFFSIAAARMAMSLTTGFALSSSCCNSSIKRPRCALHRRSRPTDRRWTAWIRAGSRPGIRTVPPPPGRFGVPRTDRRSNVSPPRSAVRRASPVRPPARARARDNGSRLECAARHPHRLHYENHLYV